MLVISTCSSPSPRRRFLITVAVPRRDFGDTFHAVSVEQASEGQPSRLDSQVLRLRNGPVVECAVRHILETWIEKGPPKQSDEERLKVRDLFVTVTVAYTGDAPPRVLEVKPVHHLGRYAGVTRCCPKCDAVDALCTCDMGGYSQENGSHRYPARLLCRLCGERWHADVVLPRNISTPPTHFLVEAARASPGSRSE